MKTNRTPLIASLIGLVIVAGIIYIIVQTPNAPTPGSSADNGNVLTDTNGPGSGSPTSGTGAGSGSAQTALGKPVVQTAGFASVSSTTAVVVGTVNPRGGATTYWFEYGTTPSFGTMDDVRTTPGTNRAVGTAGYLTDLKPNTQYYFRAAAENAAGRSYGAMYSFITAAK